MNILLIYPQCPDSFWSFKNALKFIAKKAAVPPLGLITVSAMLPPTWQKKLVDLNVSKLHESDVIWADLVFISAMYIQKESVGKIIAMCLKWQTKIVAGGPLFTQEYLKYPHIDHFVLNEAEITLPPFLSDLEQQKPKRIYQTQDYADISQTPVPDYHLLSVKDYAFMNIQVTRGCPFACSFCEITSLLGHKVRMKKTSQIIDELNVLYHQIKWRGPVSIVDDNFIGNKSMLKSSLLPAMKKWMQAHRFPFSFNIETSINLADDPELLKQLVETGFNSTFIGIETPDEESLHYCNKVQNKNRDLLESIRIIQNGGMQVSAGFIVGFDSDTPSVFQRQIDFIQQSGIVSAMVGLLNAPKNTPLYHQLKAENRLLEDPTGNNTDMSVNFITKMDRNDLLKGYKHIIHSIYSIKPYYQRLRKLLLSYNPRSNRATKINFSLFRAFLKSVLILGLLNKGRRQYWKLLTWTLFKRPSAIIDAVTYAVYGYHYRKVYGLQN
ncbi:radical SAM superfamily enzyme YgiQ (UPF0313 family) [Mangrovibacterium marinum]|uniref:Radical SAM superfamily enzyme YgiQ (UPF0313 family) n=1 Tax=Mangrovibacterium marinum TaxID=1639118 RepID=A0A2T5C1J4_9BACT|nr:B12-binding domain-containing radical SAM protein [Mangrovibacterium marinum]PTN08448.1 radical SAM superfamily enzyme YgiQ (UPF0313 family) [Mangrovibacterium marinum]